MFRSIHGVGAVMTNMVLGSGIPTGGMNVPGVGGRPTSFPTKPNAVGRGSKEDELVMETKLKIIQILQVGEEEKNWKKITII